MFLNNFHRDKFFDICRSKKLLRKISSKNITAGVGVFFIVFYFIFYIVQTQKRSYFRLKEIYHAYKKLRVTYFTSITGIGAVVSFYIANRNSHVF